MNKEATILIVDDQPHNLSVLFEVLTREGFTVFVAQDGEKAIERATYAQPDLILLDVMMPGMDGFAVCQHLKGAEATRAIPILFVSAKTETLDKVEGLAMGAADYITKPIQHEEVLARVRTHLELSRLQRQLERRNAELSAFAHTVAHDLKRPLSVTISFADLLLGRQRRLPDPDPDTVEYLEEIRASGLDMASVIDGLLLLATVAHKSDIPMEPMEMGEIVASALAQLSALIEQRQATIALPEQWQAARGHSPWIRQVWINYISNGLKYGGERPKLSLGSSRDDHGVRFWVDDSGPGLSRDAQARIFTPFTRLHKRQEGHGLGLTIAQQIVHKLGGEVGVESEPGRGSRFFFTLPGPKEPS